MYFHEYSNVKISAWEYLNGPSLIKQQNILFGGQISKLNKINFSNITGDLLL
jgi:hypothetical protein